MSNSNLKLFENKYKYLLGKKFHEFYHALQLPASKFFRINSVRELDYLKEIDQLHIRYLTDQHFNNVYRIMNGKTVSDTISFLTGGIYIQNPSSLLPVEIIAEAFKNQKNPVLLDMCAAPGGKTTALSEKMSRRGLIVANEASRTRLKSLHFNLEKYGAWNVKTTSRDGRVIGKILPETFDGILLDAPCSNENKIYRNLEVNRNWSDDLVKKMQKLQKELILSAYDALKPGGVMVYSTCTFSVEENEEVIRSLLSKHPNIEFIKPEIEFACEGISGDERVDCNVFRILPGLGNFEGSDMAYDGFFVAAIRKPGVLGEDKKPAEVKDKYEKAFRNYFNRDFEEGIFKEAGGLIFFESKVQPEIKFFKTGIKAGKYAGNDIEISSQFLWEFGASAKNGYGVQLSMGEAKSYLLGSDISKISSVQGSPVFAFYENIPVGTVKRVENRLKNKLDRYFLYGK